MKTLGDLPVGTLVGDSQFHWGFTEQSSWGHLESAPKGYEPLRWRVVCQDRCHGEATTLMADRPVMYVKYTDGAYNDFPASIVSQRLNGTSNPFFQSIPQRFRNAIVPVTIMTEDRRATDVRFFILSQVELGGGTDGIQGDHGTPIPYFAENIRNIAPTRTMITLSQHGHQIFTRSPAVHSMHNLRMINWSTTTPSIGGTNHTHGLVIPAVNLQSDVPVSDYKVLGMHLLFEEDMQPILQSLNVKVNGKWEEVTYMTVKKDSQWM
ncbi:DUF6273 domain-containing protein [Alkalihalobacterium chitinilyticum]|uniref:DUF6273 domain-containing protein n=1 Tax=Alkalihalobacterium chitinilyticum TaxID=2980103 RepID=A0ABT5VJ47_9BACI|nr:DUF6273 domain-containing protein [Alkalihalobacterium chitinilyticum]MDE5415476.1 DUF6273 domain-containing protein [Alkalihalobacterium chitinilyticum]